MTAPTDVTRTVQSDGMKVATLGEVCTFKYGKSLAAKDRTGDGNPVYGSNGVVGFHDAAQTDGPAIVVGRKGSYGEINFSSVACWPIDTTYFIDRSCTDLNLDWLKHLLPTLGLNAMNRSAAVPGLNREDAYRIPIAVPSSDEQRRVAAILDTADELRAKRRQAIAHLDALTQSIFHSIFGDLTNERQIPLRDAVAPGTIVTYGIVQAGDEYPSGVPYVRTGDIRDGRIEHEGLRRTDPAIAAKFARSRIAAGDIVMSIRATVGTVALTPQELDGANLTQGTARIAPGLETEASYLLEYLRTPRVQQWIQKQVKGATFKEITLDRLRQLPVSIPRKADQLSFGHAVGAVEKLKGKHQAHLSDLEILFASLQHRAFRGEL
jgi:type I restriction enzyme S subunit